MTIEPFNAYFPSDSDGTFSEHYIGRLVMTSRSVLEDLELQFPPIRFYDDEFHPSHVESRR